MDEGRNTINQSLQKRARAHSRLPSLQPARDLTLGNINKRTFMPNVNAKKAKEDGSEGSVKQEPKKEQREKRQREPRVPREKKRKEYIQSYSIFADGPAAAANLGRNEKPSIAGISGGGGGGGGGLRLGGVKQNSGVKKEEGGGVSVKKEKKVRSEGFLVDLKEGDMVPVVYPRKPDTSTRATPAEVFLNEESDDYEELGLIQLVNPMPVEANSPGIEAAKEGGESVDFTRLPEGEFAKLQVLDTGEVQLVIGDKNAMLKILNGTQIDHLMELVRFRTIEDIRDDEEEDEDTVPQRRNGEMHVLGRIENRFVCSVDFDSIFDEMAREQETMGSDSDSDFDDR